MTIRVREMTAEEIQTIDRLARSDGEPARLVERANIIRLARQGKGVRLIAKEMGIREATVRVWLNRFNADGLAGLRDRTRPGRPTVYSQEQLGEVLITALTNPKTLGLPFSTWTLDRLEAYLNREKGLGIKRSRIGELLINEGLGRRKPARWLRGRSYARLQSVAAAPAYANAGE